jgi:hypothetical protein
LYSDGSWIKGSYPGVTLQEINPLTFPLVAWVVYGLIQILKTQLTEMKGVVQSCTKYSKVGSKTNVVESILNWVHGKNELADILGDGPDASNNHWSVSSNW